MDAVVARSTFRSKNVQNTWGPQVRATFGSGDVEKVDAKILYFSVFPKHLIAAKTVCFFWNCRRGADAQFMLQSVMIHWSHHPLASNDFPGSSRHLHNWVTWQRKHDATECWDRWWWHFKIVSWLLNYFKNSLKWWKLRIQSTIWTHDGGWGRHALQQTWLGSNAQKNIDLDHVPHSLKQSMV